MKELIKKVIIGILDFFKKPLDFTEKAIRAFFKWLLGVSFYDFLLHAIIVVSVCLLIWGILKTSETLGKKPEFKERRKR